MSAIRSVLDWCEIRNYELMCATTLHCTPVICLRDGSNAYSTGRFYANSVTPFTAIFTTSDREAALDEFYRLTFTASSIEVGLDAAASLHPIKEELLRMQVGIGALVDNAKRLLERIETMQRNASTEEFGLE